MTRVRDLAILCSAAVLAIPAYAQTSRSEANDGDYPNRPVRLVVPSAPGSGTDIVGRMIAQALSESWGQTVVVDNRAGAGGLTAVTMLAKEASRDGYTMLLGGNGHFSFAPVLYRKLPYDPQKDLSFISLLAIQPFVVSVHPSLQVNSVKELIAAAKGKPGTIRYGSGGTATAVHMSTELLQLAAGISMLHVPYKGSGPALTALMGGEVQVLINGIAAMLPQSKSGRFKMLAVTGAKRALVAPELPTVAEAGVPGFEFDAWYGIVLPGGTPRTIVAKVNTELVKVVKSPALTQRFSAAGLEPLGSTAQEFSDLIKRESPKWQRVVQAANITIE